MTTQGGGPKRERWNVGLVAVGIAAVVLWVHAPFFAKGGVLGAPGTDVIRAAWGLDHQARALPGLLILTF